jgi:hypothetical protein
MEIKRATKEKMNALIGVMGTSGSGKTYSSLRIAAGLMMEGWKDGLAVGPSEILVIDTEDRSASLFSDEFEFDTIQLGPPYNPARFVQALHMARDAGIYGAVIIDSLSHSWIGKGGSLALVDHERAQSASGNSHFAWRKVTPLYRNLFEEIRIARKHFHVIATMRAKAAYAYEEQIKNGQKKIVPIKIGLGPEIRSGSEYTFDVIMKMDMTHSGFVEKSRCHDLDGKTFPKPGNEFASILWQWLNSGSTADELAAMEAERVAESQLETLRIYDEMFKAQTVERWAGVAYDLPGVADVFVNPAGVKMFREYIEKPGFHLENNPAMLIAFEDYLAALADGKTKKIATETAQAAFARELLASDEEE